MAYREANHREGNRKCDGHCGYAGPEQQESMIGRRARGLRDLGIDVLQAYFTTS
jgi:hypothetical protein